MENRNLLESREGAVAVLTLNRPERRNALSMGLMGELKSALERIGGDGTVRAVILGAAGKVFSAGHDLGEMRGAGLGEQRRTFALCTELMETIQAIPQPVIAQVQGVATAAGCQLVCTCDLAVAGREAKFATPGVKIGLFCSTPMVALTRAVGRKRAMEMLLTGRMVSAEEAAEWGMVNRVVEPEALEEETREMAARIAEASGFTVGLGKQAFYAQIDMDQHKAYAYAREVMTMNAGAAEAREGVSAFLEKRAPCWPGS